MTEPFEPSANRNVIPIFPLPLVLLPGEVLPLHIFEDRYRTMLKDVGPLGGCFGITLFEPLREFKTQPDLDTIGCIAEIREVEPLEDGRANIVVEGKGRFRITEYFGNDRLYLEAVIDDVVDIIDPSQLVQELADEVLTIFKRLAQAAFNLRGKRGPMPEIQPTDPELFSFLTASAFDLGNALKYELLEMTSTFRRLEKLREILLKTVEPMERSSEIHLAARTNGHGKKGIDM